MIRVDSSNLINAAAFRGEMQKMLLALGVVLLILIGAWLIEEWRMRRNLGTAIGWAGAACVALFLLGAAALVWVGLL